MANKKISELTALGAAPAGDDVLPVVDASTSTTKKVTVSNLLSSKADSSHTHAISDVTNLQTSLDAKQDSVTAGDGLSFTGSTLNAEVTQAELDGKAASSHTHTLSDITDSGTAAPLNVAASGDAASGEVVKGDDSRLTDARTPSSHTHAISEVTNLQTSLDGKASSSHNHDSSYASASHTHALTDLSNVNAGSPSDGQVLKWNNSASEWQPSADNTGSGGGGGGSGTVTSVAISGSDGIDVDSGSPITSSGTIALGLSNIGDAAISSAATWNAKQDAVTAGTGLSFTGNTLNAEVTQAELDAKPDVAGSDGQIQFNSSGSLGADSNLVWDDTNNRLGVGEASPSEKLDVNGNIAASGLRVTNGFTIQHNSSAAATSELFLKSNANMEFTIDSDDSSTDRTFRFFKGGSGTPLLRIGEDGNIGVGTQSPSHTIHALSSGNGEIAAERSGGAKLLAQAQSALGVFGTTSNHSLQLMANNTGYVTLGTNGRVTVSKSSNAEIDALTDGATITPDFNDANNFSVTLGGNRTLANPSNQTAGQSGAITITQDATGSRTLAFGSNWKFAGGTAPSLSTAANAVDVLAYYVESASRITAKLITDTK